MSDKIRSINDQKQFEWNLEVKRKEMTDFYKKKFEWFVPFWAYETREKVNPREIGRMFGCKINI